MVANADIVMRRAGAIVQPGTNCWRVDSADRFLCVQDGQDYFRLVRRAMLRARESIFILGWDILAAVDLLPGETPEDGAPTKLAELLAYVVRRQPRLRCYILIWDYAVLYTLERDPLSRWRLGWRMPRRVRFAFDNHHPVGGCHHQKIVVVDDQLAFCGGIDLTGHRWDTSAHRVEEPARLTATGPYGPYHEVHTMVSGRIATSLGELVRDRWRAWGNEKMPRIVPSREDLWPPDVTADFTDVNVAIARTVPQSETEPAIRECEALFLDSIAQAKQSIYIESQYFTNDMIGGALAARLQEQDGPEVIVVAPAECDGWLEHRTMGAFRADVFRQMIAADRNHRLRLVYPKASRVKNVPTFVHSKVMVVDDTLVRIGSANCSRRSMAVDSECDLAVDAAGDPRIEAGVRRIRDRLLAEHLGITADAVAGGVQKQGSLCQLIDACVHADRALVPLDLPPDDDAAPSDALRDAADPDYPILPVPSPAGRTQSTIWVTLMPAILTVAGLGALARHALLNPTLRNDVLAIAGSILIVAIAAGVRLVLLARQYGRSVSTHRTRAQFG